MMKSFCGALQFFNWPVTSPPALMYPPGLPSAYLKTFLDKR